MSKPKVYFLKWENHENFSTLLDKSSAADLIKPKDLTAIKMHFGEKGNDGFINPDFVRPVIKLIKTKKAKPFLTDTGTIYNGQRSNAVDHLNLAAEHGFSQTRLQVPVVIADGLLGDDHIEVQIKGEIFKKVKIASVIKKADGVFVMSHFKGHLLGGFGGAIKNLGMGCGSRLGKFEMHSSVSPEVDTRLCTGCNACVLRCAHGALKLENKKVSLDKNICAGCGECVVICPTHALSIGWSEGAEEVQKRYAEYALGAVQNKRAFYVNFVNHITPNCDCLSSKETPLCDDIGILASVDPVAIDQASFDLVVKTAGDVFKKTYPQIDSNVQLKHSAKIGLGAREYELITI